MLGDVLYFLILIAKGINLAVASTVHLFNAFPRLHKHITPGYVNPRVRMYIARETEKSEETSCQTKKEKRSEKPKMEREGFCGER